MASVARERAVAAREQVIRLEFDRTVYRCWGHFGLCAARAGVVPSPSRFHLKFIGFVEPFRTFRVQHARICTGNRLCGRRSYLT